MYVCVCVNLKIGGTELVSFISPSHSLNTPHTLTHTDGYDTPCDKISCNGVLVMSSSELSEIPPKDIWINLEDLALPDVPIDRAEVSQFQCWWWWCKIL